MGEKVHEPVRQGPQKELQVDLRPWRNCAKSHDGLYTLRKKFRRRSAVMTGYFVVPGQAGYPVCASQGQVRVGQDAMVLELVLCPCHNAPTS